jgi:hypothetical protein
MSRDDPVLHAHIVPFTSQRRVSASMTARRTSGRAAGAGLRVPATARSATPISASRVRFRFGAISWIPPIVLSTRHPPGPELQLRDALIYIKVLLLK